MKVGSAVLRAFPIPAAFFTRPMVATRGQRAVTTTPIGSIEFDFSIRVLALLLAKDFICFAAKESTATSQKCAECFTQPTFCRHLDLWKIVKCLPTDFEPWGNRPDSERGADCSCGCMFFHPLDGKEGNDWGVCFNSASPRAGLLTFEHMGCKHFSRERTKT